MRSIAPRSAVRIAVAACAAAAAVATLALPVAAVAQPASADPSPSQPQPPSPPPPPSPSPSPPASAPSPAPPPTSARPAAGVAQPAAGVAQPAPSVAQPASAELRRAGAAALEAGQLGQALSLYQRALGPTRSDPQIWFDLCLVRYAAGDYGRALNACYRALPADEGRVVALLEQIAEAMRAARVQTGRLFVPEPLQRWYESERSLTESLAASEPPAEATGAVRALDPAPLAAPGAADVIPAARLDYLRGRRPALPYSIRSRPDDYGVGVDLSGRGGVLIYAPDTTPLVAGGRLEWRWREHGATEHKLYFAEYLHAIDQTGGIAALGYGARGGKTTGSIGLAVPWGRSEGRRNVLIPDHTLALHGELRFGFFREFMIDRSFALLFETTLVGGLNLAKAAIRLGDKIGDACGAEETDCPETPDGNPGWPLSHFMIQVGVSFGYRGRHPRYARPEVFAPMGGS
jgi:hypothetical protein